jgi:hypothetical protein
MDPLARQLRIAARVLLMKHEALVSAARVGASVPFPPDAGGAGQGLPLAPPLPLEHQRLRAMMLAMIGVRGAA